jgi:hypothetical protein
VKDHWDDCDVWTQAMMLAFHQTSEHERFEEIKAQAGVK